jgi:selenocysteine-specific elongation factor
MSLVLGVVGHVDHGKTALVRALTGMETDRLPEEQARGISIALGFAHMRIEQDEIDLIDMPGHERFVRTMVSGATGIDAILLVVDAREGVMPQTREHVDIAALLGIGRAIVVVSRADLAEPGQVAETGTAAARLVAASGLQAGPPLAVSARSGAGLPALHAAIAAEARMVRPREDCGFCYLPVDRAFSLSGHGTVVTGTLRRGALAVGDQIEIVPGGMAARVRGLQVHGRAVAAAQPGQRVAANLRGVEPAQVGRGTALATRASLPAADWMSVQVTAVDDAPPLATTQRLHLLFGTEEVEARLRLLDRDALAPGETALAQLRGAGPVAVPARERFILRLLSPARTVAGGQVLDPSSGRERRHAPAVLARLGALAGAGPQVIVSDTVARAGVAGMALARLARLAGLSPALTAALLPGAGAILTRGGDAVCLPALEALMAVLPRVLSSHSGGMARETLAGLVPKASRAILDEALDRLLDSSVLARDGAAIRLRRDDQDRAAARLAEQQSTALAEALLRAGLTPPDLDELAPDLLRRRLVSRLVRDGVVVRAPDRVQKREVFFHRDAIAAARCRLSTMLTGEGLLVGEIGTALGISRKFSVPLLEYLDSVNFTRRVAERRVLAEMR